MTLAARQISNSRLVAVAWAAFWLSTAIFPCCESIAALIGEDHAVEVAPSDSAAQNSHHAGDAHTDGPVHDPDIPCEQNLSAGPVLVGALAVLASDRFSLNWVVVEEHSALGLMADVYPSNLSLPLAAPPPPRGFYQRSQRLLI